MFPLQMIRYSSKFKCIQPLYDHINDLNVSYADYGLTLNEFASKLSRMEKECNFIYSSKERHEIMKNFCDKLKEIVTGFEKLKFTRKKIILGGDHPETDVTEEVNDLIAKTVAEIHTKEHWGEWSIELDWYGMMPKWVFSQPWNIKTKISMHGPDGNRNQKKTKWGNVHIKHGAHTPLKYPCVEELYKRIEYFFDAPEIYTIISEIDRLVKLMDPEHIPKFCDKFKHIKNTVPEILSDIREKYEEVTAKTVEKADDAPTTIGASPDSYWKDALFFKGTRRAKKLRQCRSYKRHTDMMRDPDCVGLLSHYYGKSAFHAIWHGGKRRKTRRR